MPGADRASLMRAATQRLRSGGLVAFPTETVYGLGADAFNPAAIERVYELKGRPAHNPLIVHVADVAMAQRVVAAWTPDAQKLADAFWPGPLTIVLPRAKSLPDIVTAGGPTVGVRQPAHPLTLELLTSFDGPLVGPSANPSGSVSPTTADHVRAAFSEQDVLTLDGGPCARGIESTVVSLVENPPRVLRQGFVSPADIERALGRPVVVGAETPTARSDSGAALSSPGQLARHYAPRTPAHIFEASEWPAIMAAQTAPVIVLTHRRARDVFPPHRLLRLPQDEQGYAAALYRILRSADAMGAARLLIERPAEQGPLWDAIRDRLNRATTRAES